jgi:hypothetical protein
MKRNLSIAIMGMAFVGIFARANSTECSDPSGKIRYVSQSYSGGQAPPPGMVVLTEFLYYRGEVVALNRRISGEANERNFSVNLGTPTVLKPGENPMSGEQITAGLATISGLPPEAGGEQNQEHYLICRNVYSYPP